MKIIDNIKLDIALLEEVDVIEIKQSNEYVNQLHINFTNDGQPVDLTDCNVRAYLIKPDKKEDFIDLYVLNQTEGVAVLVLKPDMLYKNGVLKMEFLIYKGTEVAVTKTLVINVIKGIFNQTNVVESPQYSALTEALNKVEIILDDETIYIPGPQGPQGEQGEQGPAGIQGIDGKDGKSAYEVWLSLGNSGTEQDFLNSLKGDKGEPGEGGTGTGTGVDFENEDFMHQLEMALFNTDLSNNPLMNAGASNSIPRSTQLMTKYKKIIPAINETYKLSEATSDSLTSFSDFYNTIIFSKENAVDLSDLLTEDKTSLVSAINSLVGEIKELKQALEEIANVVGGAPDLAQINVKLDDTLQELK